jgi:hypothetical protein
VVTRIERGAGRVGRQRPCQGELEANLPPIAAAVTTPRYGEELGQRPRVSNHGRARYCPRVHSTLVSLLIAGKITSPGLVARMERLRNPGSPFPHFADASCRLRSFCRAATKQKCMAPERGLLKNTIRKQWTAIKRAPEPCGTRKAGGRVAWCGPWAESRPISLLSKKPGAVSRPQVRFILSDLRTKNRSRADLRSAHTFRVSISRMH